MTLIRVPSFNCPRCGLTSYNITDVEQEYCGSCHDWTGPESVRAADEEEVPDGNELGPAVHDELRRWYETRPAIKEDLEP